VFEVTVGGSVAEFLVTGSSQYYMYLNFHKNK